MFSFLKKPITLNCYTNRADVFNFAPIKKAGFYIPQWWKDLPAQHFDNGHLFGTMKGCPGFTDLYSKGFIMPLWSDVQITVGAKNTGHYHYQFSDKISVISTHPQVQRGSAFLEQDYQHLKLESPWLFSCDENVSFLQIGAIWDDHTPETMSVLHGVQNFKYQYSTHINTIWRRKETPEISMLNFGQPITHFIPLTERKVVFKLHLVSDTTIKNLRSISTRVSFVGKYKNTKKMLKVNGCPFHFKPEK